MPLLENFGPSIWTVNGPTVNFYGFPYTTRMAIVKLSDGTAWVWSPVSLTNELATEIEATVGPVCHIVSPNKIHHLFLKQWADTYPDARVYAPPGLQERNIETYEEIKFFGVLSDDADKSYVDDIDQVVFRGSCVMEEVVFCHKISKTLIVGDLIQRFPEEEMTGWKGMLMRMDGMVGEQGSTPREWRLSFLMGKKEARRARDLVMKWNFEKLLVAHGDCVKASNAKKVVASALSWI